MKTTIYDTTSLPSGDVWDALRENAITAMEEGEYASSFGLHDDVWETYSEPGDAYLALAGGYCTAVALIAHDDVLRIIVTTQA